jgi:acetyltransferase
MSDHYLAPLFAPRSLVLAGASERAQSLGRTIMENLAAARFHGAVVPLNPKHATVFGRRCYSSLAELEPLGDAPDLLVIASPADTAPDLIRQAAKVGIRHAMVLSGKSPRSDTDDDGWQRRLRNAVRDSGVRLLGPLGIGLLRPSIGLNATSASIGARSGSTALVSQSGAVCAALLDWAAATEIGFSSVVSLGSALDIDFGEVLNFLVQDAATRSILIYVEKLRTARGFLSALRAAARVKPVVVFKAGRHAIENRSGADDAYAALESDLVFDAALARAGTVRVHSSMQLFAAARILAAGKLPNGDRLAIVTNGRGPGIVAADHALDLGLAIAAPSLATQSTLARSLPPHASTRNPVDVTGDATPEQLKAALDAVAADENIDAILALFAPQGMTSAAAAAQAAIAAGLQTTKPILAAWLGGASIAGARALFEKSALPNFMAPELAVEALSFLVRFRRHQRLLLETAQPHAFMSAREAAAAIASAAAIRDVARGARRHVLGAREAQDLLSAFGVRALVAKVAHTREQAIAVARKLGYPVALKALFTPDADRSQGDIRALARNSRQVGTAFEEVVARQRGRHPASAIIGVGIQPAAWCANGRTLSLGFRRDAVFGPVLRLAHADSSADPMTDAIFALPPLNKPLIASQAGPTRMAKLLGTPGSGAAIDLTAMHDLSLRVSMIACLLPWIDELELSPLVVHHDGVSILDVRIVLNDVATVTDPRYHHMAIFPYPVHLERHVKLRSGQRIAVRPIRPDDAEREIAFVKSLDDTTRYYRFQHPVKELSAETIVRFTQLDYAREMALVALDPAADAIIAVARYFPNPDNAGCEFAIAVGGPWQKQGIGRQLMVALIACAKESGYRYMDGHVLSGNRGMLHLATALGFTCEGSKSPEQTVRVALSLQAG